MSEHRRRSPGKRRAARRKGVPLPAAATAVTAVAGIAVAGYLVILRPGHSETTGAAIAAAAISSSRAVAVLEQQRQQMIVLAAASHTMHMVGAPKVVAAKPAQSPAQPAASSGAPATVSAPPPDPGTAQSIAYSLLSSYGWNPKTYFSCLNNIWSRESGWNYQAENASGAFGIPQALPGSKMATAGADWATNPKTQIIWGLGYIQGRYGDPCSAWTFWQANGFY